MSELAIVIDHWGHKELKEYLMSLNGILDVEIKNDINDEQLNIYLKYNSDLISPKIIKMEILFQIVLKGLLRLMSIMLIQPILLLGIL